MELANPASTDGRWSLYRLLADPARLRLLALAAEAEFSIGELAELLDEPQPNVSRQATNLRQGGLVAERREGTRTLVRIAESSRHDPVVCDAIAVGRFLCLKEGRFERIAAVIRKRDERARRYEVHNPSEEVPFQLALELPVYALAVAQVTVERRLAVDARTGDGAMLDLLAPFFERVVAVDPSPLQLRRAERRVRHRGYDNVELVCGEIGDDAVLQRIQARANAVFAVRALQIETSPRVTMAALGALLLPGGELLVVEHHRYDGADRDQRAGVRIGFTRDELLGLASAAGLVRVVGIEVPRRFAGDGGDTEPPWQLLRAMRPALEAAP
jgi:DNA-binding transcriptional ArsR family regulator